MNVDREKAIHSDSMQGKSPKMEGKTVYLILGLRKIFFCSLKILAKLYIINI